MLYRNYQGAPYLISDLCLCRYATATSSPSGQITNMEQKSVTNARWRRVIFKISGAALSGPGSQSIDPKVYLIV